MCIFRPLFFRLRNVHSSERSGQNVVRSEEHSESQSEKKKFFRHRKKYSSRENSENEDKRKIVVPEHEFEEKFNVKPPPKNLNGTGESQQFNNWFFRDTNDDLDAMESYQSHNEVNK